MDVSARMEINRPPAIMTTGELAAVCQLARALAGYRPSAYLAKPLANWLFTAERELARRQDGRDAHER